MFEIVAQHIPYLDEIRKSKKRRKPGSKGMDMDLVRRIAKGLLRPELDDTACSKFRVGRSYTKLFARCVAFEPRERPEAEEVARQFEEFCKRRERLERLARGDTDAMPSVSSAFKVMANSGLSAAVTSPWAPGSAATTAFQSFASRLESEEERTKLRKLRSEVETMLGADAVSATKGVWNSARLLRFLKISGLDVNDAKAQIAASADTRTEHDMDGKRRHIVEENMSFDSIVSFGRGWGGRRSAATGARTGRSAVARSG